MRLVFRSEFLISSNSLTRSRNVLISKHTKINLCHPSHHRLEDEEGRNSAAPNIGFEVTFSPSSSIGWRGKKGASFQTRRNTPLNDGLVLNVMQVESFITTEFKWDYAWISDVVTDGIITPYHLLFTVISRLWFYGRIVFSLRQQRAGSAAVSHFIFNCFDWLFDLVSALKALNHKDNMLCVCVFLRSTQLTAMHAASGWSSPNVRMEHHQFWSSQPSCHTPSNGTNRNDPLIHVSLTSFFLPDYKSFL